jgi:hypothetical protein
VHNDLPPLPEPGAHALGSAQLATFTDALSAHFSARLVGMSARGALYAAASAVFDAQQEIQTSTLESQQQARQAASEAQLKSIREATEADGNKSFWGKIADVAKYVGMGAAIVGSALALAFTGGASTLVLVASITALVAATATLGVEIYQQAGGRLPPEVGYVLLGLSIASAGLSLGASLGSTASAASTAASAASRTAATVSQVTNIVGGASQVAQGTSAIVSGVYAHQASNARADGADAERVRDHATHLLNEAMTSLHESSEDLQRMNTRAAQIEQLEHRSRMITLRA